eukprot:1025117-Pyramimonas_sp.AAC.2
MVPLQRIWSASEEDSGRSSSSESSLSSSDIWSLLRSDALSASTPSHLSTADFISGKFCSSQVTEGDLRSAAPPSDARSSTRASASTRVGGVVVASAAARTSAA